MSHAKVEEPAQIRPAEILRIAPDDLFFQIAAGIEGRPGISIFQVAKGESWKFYQIHRFVSGEVRVVDMTAVIGPNLAARPKQAKIAHALSAKVRQRANRKRDQDSYERTFAAPVDFGKDSAGWTKPTAEAEAQMTRRQDDLLQRLIENDRITTEQSKAAVEIADIFQSVACGLLPKASSYERIDGRGQESVSPKLAAAWKRYVAWTEHLGGVPGRQKTKHSAGRTASRGRCPDAVRIAIDVLIDGLTLKESDIRRRWKKGLSREYLCFALAVYTDLSGWEKNRDSIHQFLRTLTMPGVANRQGRETSSTRS